MVHHSVQPSGSRGSAGARRRAASVASLIALSLAACDIPTSAPKWSTRWVVPTDSLSIAVASLLPSAVSIAPDSSAFRVTVDSTEFLQSLGQACEQCRAVNGSVAPKPAFATVFGSSIALPQDVASVMMSRGSATVQLFNGFGFDPLRPSALARGSLTITLASRGATLASVTVDGADTPLAPNQWLSRTLPLASATLAGPITVSVALDSPAGDPTWVDTTRQLTVVAKLDEVDVSEASIRVDNKSIDPSQVELNFDNVDQRLIDRVEDGALRFEIGNPFQVGGSIQATLQTPTTTVVKTFTVEPGAATQRLELTNAELRSILGQPSATLVVSGALSAPSGVAVIRPRQAISIGSRVEVALTPTEQ